MNKLDLVLRVHNLRKQLSGSWILRGVSFEVARGHVHLLLGPNGSGKTSTLKCILGLYPSCEGTIELKVSRSKLGYVPEIPYRITGYSVRDLLELAALRGSGGLSSHTEILERLSLLELLDRSISSLSKGQRKRVYIAAALVAEPELLIMDEPFSGLDVDHVVMLKQLISELRREGVTVLVSSHVLLELEDLVDRVTVLHQGTSLRTLDPRQLDSSLRLLEYSVELTSPSIESLLKALNEEFKLNSWESLGPETVRLEVSVPREKLSGFYELLAEHKALILRLELKSRSLYELYRRTLAGKEKDASRD